MRILFVADPLSALKPAGDTTLALLHAVIEKGWEAYWSIPSQLEYQSPKISIFCQKIVESTKGAIPQVSKVEQRYVEAFDAVLIRKDPPFDASYVRLCWFLGLLEHKVWMLNTPSVLLRYHEKMIPLQAVTEGYLTKDEIIPTFIGSSEGGRQFVKDKALKKVISKPFLGYGGNEIHLLEEKDFGMGHWTGPDAIIQPFQESVYTGDHRVFYLDGKILFHFLRVPAKGGFISNMAQGGTPVASPLSAAQRATLEKLGNYLKKVNIPFAGADLIGNCISEVNITSPTGFRAIEKIEGKDYAPEVIEFLGKRVIQWKTRK